MFDYVSSFMAHKQAELTKPGAENAALEFSMAETVIKSS